MKFAQLAKRVFLFAAVNILVMTTVTLVLALLGAGHFIPRTGLGNLAAGCLVWGFGVAFISLLLSRLMAKWMMGVQVVPPDTTDPTLRELVDTIHGLARQAGLPMPEVGIYESPDVNAFATGPSKSRSLVAVSTGLLQNMNSRQVAGVLGHEITHIANGDMVTMTLIQGVINAFVFFLSRVLAFAISQALRSRNSRDSGGGFIQFALILVFQIVFSIFGSIVVCWFSRQREFRADAGGARLAGRENMIDALHALQRLHNPAVAAAESQRAQSFQSLKISGPRGMLKLFATHPPIEVRIARLESGTN
jgi:heat shock protein HtpX